MNQPLVSVIIPVYNSEPYLKQCLENILGQTYSNLQIILVNDGSTDGSLSVCRQVSDPRVEVYSKENGGASSARNFGLQYRKGEYVLFVDSDDALKSDAVEILVCKAEDTQADCVYFEADNDTEEEGIAVKKQGLMQAIEYPLSDGNTLIDSLLEHKNYHAVPFLYFARSDLYDRGLSFEEGIMFEDELFSFNLLRMCRKVVCLKEVLYYRKVRANSVMTSTGKERFRFHSISVVYERLYERFLGGENDPVFCRYLSRIGMLWLGYWEQLSKEIRSEVEERYRTIKQQILQHRGFGSKELVARCHSRILWFVTILPGRVLKKIRKK